MAQRPGQNFERMAFGVAFGGKVRAVRKNKRLHLPEVEIAADIGFSQLSKIERGLTVPSVYSAWKIARALGVSLDDLMPDEEPKEEL